MLTSRLELQISTRSARPRSLMRAALLAVGLIFGATFSAESQTQDQSPVTTDGLACTTFAWSASEQSPHTAMLVPINLDGQAYTFQLDTGADVLITYGATEHPGWEPHGKARRIPNVKFAGMSFASALGYPNLQMSDQDGIQGTVGLDLLVGQVFIIDFPKQRVCLLSHSDTPQSLYKAASWVPGEIRHGHFYIDVTAAGSELKGIIYDTGSSPRGLDVDFDVWKNLTGRPDAAGTVPAIEEKIWGKPVHLIQAPIQGVLKIGDRSYANVMASTVVEQPHSYREELSGNGVIGNTPFLRSIVILDLGSFPGFGVIDTAPVK